MLRSLQGTLYRVHSFTLRATSGLFATMFSLPQPRKLISWLPEGDSRVLGKQTIQADILDVYEDDFPLEHLLRLMSGLPTTKVDSLADFEKVVRIAEKWDTSGPLSIIRHSLNSKQFLEQDALRCYSIAKHFGWGAEAKAASTHTLVLDLCDPIHTPIMELMSSKDLLVLLELHRKRRDLLRDLLDSPERFAAGNRFVRFLGSLFDFINKPCTARHITVISVE